jgi:phospholipase D1/2
MTTAGEDFAAYVVVPMWPEGIPTDVAIQEILAFQYSTMEMVCG